MPVAAPTQSAVGTLFGLPGITRPISVKENNDATTTTLNLASATAASGLVPFKQSDIVEFYELQLSVSQTVTANTATISTSPYFPYNILGAGELSMQYQFSTLKWLSGMDLAIWQSYRPAIQTQFRDVLYQIPRSNAYSAPAATNLPSASNYTSGSSTILLRYELPVALWFDAFYPLDADGRILGPAQRALVSPQFMSGTQRVVQPILNYNQQITVTTSAQLDQSPYSSTGTQTTPATYTGTATQYFRRNGYYQPQGQQDSPPVYNWQYTRRAYQYSLVGRSSVDIPVPTNGQILSIFVRMFDPSSGSVGGAAIPLANVTRAQLQYASGFYRFDDTPRDMEARFIAQHGITTPAEGVIVWDMAQDKFGRVTNAFALNTLNTSGVAIHIDFTGAQSSTAYAVVGVEALQWAAQG